jgi:TolA-binding protein
VYFHLAESLYRENKKPEALPYFERLIKEFEKSEYLEATQKRIAELKNPS